jgi:hypothetical protein
MASRNSQVSIAMSGMISPSFLSNILREVIPVIIKYMKPIYLPKRSKETWKKNADGFLQRKNFPNCIGAMDGKHVRIQAPSQSGSTNYNYKGYHSIVLMAIVDPFYKFTLVDIGTSRSQSDGGVLSSLEIGRRLYNGTLQLSSKKECWPKFATS